MTGPGGAVLVIGSGIAGMQSSLLLASMGRRVFLVEREPAIGGFFPLLDRTFPTDSCGVCFMHPAPPALCPIHESRLHPLIEPMPNTDLVKLSGRAGAFTALLRHRPRFVDPERCNLCGECLTACPVEVADPFGGGLTVRRAIHSPFPQANPPSPVIDPALCDRCGACVAACPTGAINLDAEPWEETIEAAAVIVGAGFAPVPGDAAKEFGFPRFPNVLTAVQFERMLSTSGPTGGLPLRPSDGRPIRRLGFIQCVGSRDAAHGRPDCSSICCMYAVKQAVLAAERMPGLVPVIHCMDLRAVGKGYERYVREAERKGRVVVAHGGVSSVRELPGSRDLLLGTAGGNGRPVELTYDAVVLSTGFMAPAGGAELAAALGISLEDGGWCRTDPVFTTRTGLPGVFVAGAFGGPRDIPETTVEACAAVAEAASLAAWGETTPEDSDKTVDRAAGDQEPRIGVVLCRCRGAVGGTVDLAAVAARAGGLKGVCSALVVDDACIDAARRELAEGAKGAGANRLVFAGCAGRKAEPVAMDIAGEAGIDPGLIVTANLLEQCAMVHRGDPKGATARGIDAVAMAVERAMRADPAPRFEAKMGRTVLVVGGGPAGMTASLRLADLGFAVELVERSGLLGGGLRDGSIFCAGPWTHGEILEDLVGRVGSNPAIRVHLDAEPVASTRGNSGFATTVRDSSGDETTLVHESLIVATGGHEAAPAGWGLGEDSRVTTQRGLERMLEEADPALGRCATVAMIQCAGSRDEVRPWCSRTCCTRACANAIRLLEAAPATKLFVLHRDVRTTGRREGLYREARSRGAIFVRMEGAVGPTVAYGEGGVTVSTTDRATGRPFEIAADLVVLSNGMEPHDNRALASVFGLPLDADGFFAEANPKSAPLDALHRGVFLCGLGRMPDDLAGIIASGEAAAARAAAFLAQGMAEAVSHRVTVSRRLCSGCALCVAACPYGARALDQEGKATVSELLCRGCGSCAAVCRNGATRQANFGKGLMMAVIDRGI